MSAPVNQYGYTEEEWAAFSRHQRYTRKLKATDPEKYQRVVQGSRNRWRERNPEKTKASNDKYFKSERAKLLKTKYLEENRERIYADQRRWRQERPEAYRKLWRAAYHRRKSKQRIHMDPNKVYAQINKAVSRALPRHVRDDLIGAMCLAVLEGKLLVSDIDKEARKFLTEHNRQYDTFKTLSLDATIPGTDQTYLDRVVDQATEHEAWA